VIPVYLKNIAGPPKDQTQAKNGIEEFCEENDLFPITDT
jgi:hypothetical protein